jgi:Protein of unknown function (DUF2865)
MIFAGPIKRATRNLSRFGALMGRRKRRREEYTVSKKRENVRVSAKSLTALAVVAISLALPATNASAAGFFEFLFGGGRGSAPSAPSSTSVTPMFNAFASPDGAVERDRRESGPSVAYCVRLCDGHPFPVQSTGSSSAQACASMCPAAQTKVFSGGSIDHAVSNDGKRYSDLANAFTYRKQLVNNCTCNGKTAGGLVRVDVKADPTLRAGDIVATNNGLVSYRGSNGKTAEFSPVQDRKLANIEIRQAPIVVSAAAANARAEAPPVVEDPASKAQSRRAQR